MPMHLAFYRNRLFKGTLSGRPLRCPLEVGEFQVAANRLNRLVDGWEVSARFKSEAIIMSPEAPAPGRKICSVSKRVFIGKDVLGFEGLELRAALIVVLLLLLISISSAKQQFLEMGSYNVSFDLNTTSWYNISNVTEHSETYCGAEYDVFTTILNNSQNFAFIVLTCFSINMDKSRDQMQYEIEKYLGGLGYNDTATYERKIDGKSGIMGIGANSNRDYMFATNFWLPDGNTYVLIVSNYLWSNETLNLLKSIHFKRIKK